MLNTYCAVYAGANPVSCLSSISLDKVSKIGRCMTDEFDCCSGSQLGQALLITFYLDACCDHICDGSKRAFWQSLMFERMVTLDLRDVWWFSMASD